MNNYPYKANRVSDHIVVNPMLIEIDRKSLFQSKKAVVKYDGLVIGEIFQKGDLWYKSIEPKIGYEKPMYPARLLIIKHLKERSLES